MQASTRLQGALAMLEELQQRQRKQQWMQQQEQEEERRSAAAAAAIAAEEGSGASVCPAYLSAQEDTSKGEQQAVGRRRPCHDIHLASC